MALPHPRGYVVSWNLTRRCNLFCQHCFMEASPDPYPSPGLSSPLAAGASGGEAASGVEAAESAEPGEAAERGEARQPNSRPWDLPARELTGELATDEALSFLDEISQSWPGTLLIFSGGEPLLRPDLVKLTSAATERGFFVVVGTNGLPLSRQLLQSLKEAGMKGMGVSLDAASPEIHDSFRRRPQSGPRQPPCWPAGPESSPLSQTTGAWSTTMKGMTLLHELEIPFIVQTTVTGENHSTLPQIVALALERGAKVHNLYFLVPTGRGRCLSSLSLEQHETLLHTLLDLQREYDGKILLNVKCAPHFQRVLYQDNPSSPYLKGFKETGGCPAGIQYCGITPEGNVTPCPYLPLYGGNLREKRFQEILRSPLFEAMKARSLLQGRCGKCEFALMCGGCRARAFAVTGEPLASDPLCPYDPGEEQRSPIQLTQSATYGQETAFHLQWASEARERIEKVPAFVRGTVIRQVEEAAERNGMTLITPTFLQDVRERMMGSRIAHLPLFRSEP